MRLRKRLLLMVVVTAAWPIIPCVARAQQSAKPALEFDVASVRENQDQSVRPGPTNVPLDTEDAFAPTGGLFSAKGFTLVNYIAFAYRQQNSPALRDQLPRWAQTARFDIEARADGNPTKDQYREMMRSLLAERFKLQVHTENRKVPIFAMVLAKPGQPGPQLRAHPASDDCSGVPTISPMGTASGKPPEGADLKKPATLVGLFPPFCGGFIGGVAVDPENSPGLFMAGGRGMTMELLADVITQRAPSNNIGDCPVVDRTGLTGKYDFIVEWTSPSFASANTGPTTSMEDALKGQLGLKLDRTEAPVDILLIDHVERPTEN